MSARFPALLSTAPLACGSEPDREVDVQAVLPLMAARMPALLAAAWRRGPNSAEWSNLLGIAFVPLAFACCSLCVAVARLHRRALEPLYATYL